MQILNSNDLEARTRKSKFCSLVMILEEGWGFSDEFIDYESKLLVISTRPTDESKWKDSGFGFRSIPTKRYIVDTNTSKILTHKEWGKYFSYEPVEIFSKNKLYRLIIRRIYEPKRKSDFIKQELFDLIKGEIIATSDGVAFRDSKDENLLESHERKILEDENKQKKLNAMPTLVEFFENEFKNLSEKDVVLNFASELETFELTFRSNQFELKIDNQISQTQSYKTYQYLNDFTEEYMCLEDWYLKLSPLNIPDVHVRKYFLFEYFIVEFANKLRKTQSYTRTEYNKLTDWENFVRSGKVKPTERKQFCSNCDSEVMYWERYLKHLCQKCASKITDINGRLLSFGNTSVSGGCQGYYADVETSQKYKSNKCYVNGIEYYAEEARFGGIVIQKNDVV